MPYKNEEDRKAYLALYGETHRHKLNTRIREYKLSHPEARMLVEARSRAKHKGQEFSILIDDIFIPDNCPCCGVKLVPATGRVHQSMSPTLDRVSNNLGYVPGNVWVICYRCNAIKRDADPDELRKIAATVENFLLTNKKA